MWWYAILYDWTISAELPIYLQIELGWQKLQISLLETEFKLVDDKGNAVEREDGVPSLLLYNGGTVCQDHFNYNAATAICREMGYAATIGRWETRKRSMITDYQRQLDITLDYVRCRTGNWSSCYYKEKNNCEHADDIFLACDAPPEPGLFTTSEYSGLSKNLSS